MSEGDHRFPSFLWFRQTNGILLSDELTNEIVENIFGLDLGPPAHPQLGCSWYEGTVPEVSFFYPAFPLARSFGTSRRVSQRLFQGQGRHIDDEAIWA